MSTIVVEEFPVTEGGGPPSSYLSKPFTKRGAESKGIDHCSALKLGRLPSFGFDQSLYDIPAMATA
jgi:hypothetical protein